MAFNTGSFLAGVGAVVAVLSTGFAGGGMVANPNHTEPPNRLQRLAADSANAKAVTPASVAADDKPSNRRRRGAAAAAIAASGAIDDRDAGPATGRSSGRSKARGHG